MTSTVNDHNDTQDAAGNAILEIGGRYSGFKGTLEGMDNGLFYLNDTSYYDPAIAGAPQDRLFLVRIAADLSVDTQVLLHGDDYGRWTAIGDGAADGVAIANASETGTAAYLTLLDNELNVTHSLYFGGEQGSVALADIDTGHNDRTVAVGYESVAGDARDAYIVSLDPDGSMHAEFHFDDPAFAASDEAFSDVLVLADNSVLAWNDQQLFKFDEDLNLQRAIAFDTALDSVTARPDGSLLVLTDSQQDVFRLDAALNVTDAWQGERDVGPGQFNIFPSVAELSGDTLSIAAGRSYQPGFSMLTFDLDDFTPGGTSVTSVDTKAVDASLLSDTAQLEERSISLGSDRETLYVTDPSDGSMLSTAQGSIEPSDFSYTMTALASTDDAYPDAQPLAWNAGTISLVGSGGSTATHVSDGLTLSA